MSRVRTDSPPQEQLAVDGILRRRRVESGFEDFVATIEEIARARGAGSLLEIGAGRNPFLSGLAESIGIDYAANDIDESELALGARNHDQLVFDICGPTPSDQMFDMVVSRSVLEHVVDVERALRNTERLLKPNGIGLHFIPTLYCLPFLANRLLPDRLALLALRLFAPRDEGGQPKFPAYYHRCKTTHSNLAHLNTTTPGAQISAVPYFQHGYYNRLPGVAPAVGALHSTLERFDARTFSSYCWLIVEKTGDGTGSPGELSVDGDR